MLRAFRRSPTAVVGTVILILLAAVAIVAPVTMHARATALNVTAISQPPGNGHPLGTDQLGRDIFARLLVATGPSLLPALIATLLAAILGIPFGASIAQMGTRLRSATMRVLDTLLAFPPILVAIFLVVILGPTTSGLAISIGIPLAFRFARVTGMLALSIGGREFVHAARVLGVPRRRLLGRYIVPNLAETLLVVLSNAVATSIVAVASLSFLGLGTQPPKYDWGSMLTNGVQYMYENPAAAIGPAVAIALAALGFGLVGEGLGRASNPLARTRKRAARGPVTPAASVNGTSPSDNAQLDVHGLTVSFPGATVVDGVSFTVKPGERVGMVGESGSGKSMTALAIAQLLPSSAVTAGSITFGGEPLSELPARRVKHLLGLDLGLVYQDPMSSLNPALRIGTQLTEPARVHRRLSHREAAKIAVERLKESRFPTPEAQLRRYPHELSGGMRQRAMIAMGLMNEPKLLIADEPTTALDVTIQAQIMEILRTVNEQHGTAILFISHNLGLVSQHCDRVLVMYAGRIVEDLTTDQLVDDPQHPYTRALMSVVPGMARRTNGHLPFIPGQAPDLADPPSGCPFHPRCPLADERCRANEPPLLAVDDRRVACWKSEVTAAHD